MVLYEKNIINRVVNLSCRYTKGRNPTSDRGGGVVAVILLLLYKK